MILLDTNFISELMRSAPDRAVQKWLMSLNNTQLCISAVSVSEIEYGLRRLPDGKRRKDLAERFAHFAASLVCLPFEREAACYAGQFRALREKKGVPTTASDMMIAGIAAYASAALATRNIRDFQHLPIELIDPWQG